MKKLILAVGLMLAASAYAQTCKCPDGPIDPPPPPAGTCPVVQTSPFALGNPSVTNTWRGTPGTIYTTKLPKLSGGIGNTRNIATDGGASIEWSISPCPGDFTYYKSAAATVTLGFGGKVYPCGGVFGPESGGLNWATVQSASRPLCIVNGTGNWYLNMRATKTSIFDFFWN